jgi:hypothetical protein
MKGICEQIKALVERGDVQISDHGYDELAADVISVRDVVTGLSGAEVLEEYPDYSKGPSVLVLEYNAKGDPIHAVWGIPKSAEGPAVLVTAYRPDPLRWTKDFRRRKQ